MSNPSGLQYFIDVPTMNKPVVVPDSNQDPLVVGGWVLPPRGRKIQAVELFIEGRLVAVASLEGERPDVLASFPDRPEALRAGFTATVPAHLVNGAVRSGGSLAVHARWDGGEAVLSEFVFQAAAASDLAKVSDFWAEQFEARRNNGSYWLNNTIIQGDVYRLMTDEPYHWLAWLMKHYFAGVERFERVLSICCGDGAHELELLRSGKVRHLTGFDISEGAVQQARERIRGAGFGDDRFHLEVRDANRLALEGRYDLIFSVGAVHHVENLEGLMAEIARALDPKGFFVLVEFVGPNRFQWTDDQIEIVNGVLETLDVSYLLNGSRTKFGRPSIADMMRIDPSEAVRSSEILGLIRQHFSVVYEREFNGALMHHVYPLLNADLAEQNKPDFDSLVRLLLYFENVLTKRGVLPADFVFLICRPRQQP